MIRLSQEPEQVRRGLEAVRERLRVQSKTASAQSTDITFEEQTVKFLFEGQTRKRNPIRINTLRTYESALRKHILPFLGHTLLQDVKNKQVKDFAVYMHEKGLAASTISLNVNIIKDIVASAIDENGDALCIRKWNSDFIDLPAIENQKQPTVAVPVLHTALESLTGDAKGLVCLLAGTGLRIGEALNIWAAVKPAEIDPKQDINVYLPEYNKIVIRGQLNRDGQTGPTKTKAGAREVDLAPALNEFLKKMLTNKTENFKLFPQSRTSYHKLFRKAGLLGGFHSLRRFRETHLEKQNTPRMLMKFWTGHAAADISERYIKVGQEIETRRKQAEIVGLGFELPESI